MSVSFCFTSCTDGSFALSEAAEHLAARRTAVAGVPVTWLRQVHGARCVVVERPGDACGVEADAAVTATPGAALSVITADCAPVLLHGDGVVGAAHAGWRGLAAGVLQETVRQMRALGAEDVTAQLGPCIRGRCYEFGASDLDEAARALGDDVVTTTAWGTPGFDVTVGVRNALAAVDVSDVFDDGLCTACSPVHWSHRARADRGRQAGFIWLDA